MWRTKAYLGTYLPTIITTHLIKHPKRWVSKGWATETNAIFEGVGVGKYQMCKDKCHLEGGGNYQMCKDKCYLGIFLLLLLLLLPTPTKPFKEVGIKWVVPRTNAIIKVSIYLPSSYYPPNTTI
jgi:hypothetical protein